jgi:hypothetical protein
MAFLGRSEMKSVLLFVAVLVCSTPLAVTTSIADDIECYDGEGKSITRISMLNSLPGLIHPRARMTTAMSLLSAVLPLGIVMGDLSEHFSREEFACSCGCGFDTVDTELLRILEVVRTHFDRPVTVNSACRCVDRNHAVGGSSNSQHLYGRAADIVVQGIDPSLVYELVDQMGIGGAGEYTTFTHIDSRTNGPARWEG